MQVQIICGAQVSCGFRVHSEYFRDKPRFAPGICPKCNGPLAFVEAYTEHRMPGVTMSLAKHSEGGGALLGVPAPKPVPTTAPIIDGGLAIGDV